MRATFQARGNVLTAQSILARAEGRYDEALSLVRGAGQAQRIGLQVDATIEALAEAAEIAQLIGDPGAQPCRSLSACLIGPVPPAHEAARVPARAHPRQCSRRPGRRSGGGRSVRARPRQRPQFGEPTWLAPILLDYGSWLVNCGREDDAAPLLAEAGEIYGKLGAVRMLAAGRGRSAGGNGGNWGVNGVACPSCETLAAPGAKFCAECGTPLATRLPFVRHSGDAAAKFCAECGTPLGASAPAPAAAPPPPRPSPSAGSSRFSSPTSSASRRSPRAATPRRRASSSRATSRRRGA